jgi:hypothetical protein
VTYASQLWRVQASDRTLTNAQKVRLALGRDPNLLQVTVTPDGDTGALWVAFFARSEGGITGARVGQRAMLALAALPEFAGVEVKPEWGGVVYPEPDPARPETFPPVATIEWVTAMRHTKIFGGSNPNARWYQVSAQVHGLDRSLVVQTAAAMDVQIKRMRRVDRPRVGVSKDGSVVDLRFLIGGVGPQDAAREAFHLADALVTMTVDDEDKCRIEVQDVSEAAPRTTS